MAASDHASVYVVPYMDGAWVDYDPLSPEVDYAAVPFNEAEVVSNLKDAIPTMKDLIDAKFVFGVHTGVYCRNGFHSEELLELYRQLIAAGGEVALHPHEELVKESTLVAHEAHMEKVITDQVTVLREAGIPVATYRGGYGAFSDQVRRILEGLDILSDLSATPGKTMAHWDAHWEKAPTSAFYLQEGDPFVTSPDGKDSSLLEIPLGWDGAGTRLDANYLNEESSIEDMKNTYQQIADRAEESGKPQIVHFMCHLFAMADRDMRARCLGILEHVQDSGGVILTPSEAVEVYRTL